MAAQNVKSELAAKIASDGSSKHRTVYFRVDASTYDQLVRLQLETKSPDLSKVIRSLIERYLAEIYPKKE